MSLGLRFHAGPLVWYIPHASQAAAVVDAPRCPVHGTADHVLASGQAVVIAHGRYRLA